MNLHRTLRRAALSLAASGLLLAGPGPAQDVVGPARLKDGPPPRILDRPAAQRLRANKGISLQWIDWQRRGTATIAVDRRGGWRLRGEQAAVDGPGRLLVQGKVTEIGRDYFLLEGTVRITDAPDAARNCEAHKVWRFAVTQNRRYWRLREFEWCDGLTDYVDIYF